MKKPFMLILSIFAFSVSLWANGSTEYEVADLLPVENFEKSDTVKALKEKWITYSDQAQGAKSSLELKGLVSPGYADSQYCLHATWQMDAYYATPYVGFHVMLNTATKGIDLTGYEGVRFFARGKGKINVHLGIPATQKEYNYHRTANYVLYSTWQVYEIPFSKFRIDWGTPQRWDASNVLLIEWDSNSPVPREGEIYLDDISFYKLKPKEVPQPRQTSVAQKEKGVEPEPAASTFKAEQVLGKRVAVVGVESKAIPEDVARALVDFIINAYVNDGSLKVVDRTSIEKILDEQAFQTKDFADTEKMLRVGKIAGADFISLGSISKVGSMYYLNIKLISVQTAEIIGSSIATANDDSGFFMMTNTAVNKLFKH